MIAAFAVCVSTLLMTVDGQVEPKIEQVEPKIEKFELLQIEKNIITFTNAERARYGLAPLKTDEKLVKSAREHATWMTLNRTLRHTRQAVAENIAMGQRNSTEAVADWMSSSGHRANILNRGYTKIGAAAYRTTEGRIYWCQQFLR
jgi:uncharacterized protein YkwD